MRRSKKKKQKQLQKNQQLPAKSIRKFDLMFSEEGQKLVNLKKKTKWW